MNYVHTGSNIIDNYKFDKLSTYPNIYVYGCGQFLFKLLNKIKQFTNIINIIDDNTCYKNKFIDNIAIINNKEYIKKIHDNDETNVKSSVVLITSLVHFEKIKEKLLSSDKDIVILNISEL